jgi:hypothetical protein
LKYTKSKKIWERKKMVLIDKQREFFESGKTLSYEARRDSLKKLRDCVKKNENEIIAALKSDLGKSAAESFMSEIGLFYDDIAYNLKNLKKHMRPERCGSPLSIFPSKSQVLQSPYGLVLIISPWNYPFLLTLEPLADALAAVAARGGKDRAAADGDGASVAFVAAADARAAEFMPGESLHKQVGDHLKAGSGRGVLLLCRDPFVPVAEGNLQIRAAGDDIASADVHDAAVAHVAAADARAPFRGHRLDEAAADDHRAALAARLGADDTRVDARAVGD